MTSYRTLSPSDLCVYLGAHEALGARLGAPQEAWTIREVSDGNLNHVFIVEGPAGAVCCKQSLPHVRVDPSWKMPLTRTDFEARYMRRVAPHVGHLMPALLHFDPDLHLIVMESLHHHHVLRGMLGEASALAGFSARIGEYVAHAAFFTSWRGRPFEQSMADCAAFAGNTTLTRITVDLVLTDPYRAACARNHWMTPELDGRVAELQADPVLHASVSHWQERFLSAPQALLHGDLHTGSIMVHGDDVRVIDGEFALMGPIGFDAGLYVGNLLLHAAARRDHAAWMADEIETFWRSFTHEYRALWEASPTAGDVGALLDAPGRHQAQAQELAMVMRDLAGFAGMEMIRRTIGYAQVSDYALCSDRTGEKEARLRALALGRTLITRGRRIETINTLLETIEEPGGF